MGEIKIDSEFQTLIPPLTDDEFQRLEKSILAEGVREPIITWNDTIIDGHNRYRICQEHGIVFGTTKKEFTSRGAAKIWIIENQFARRNLDDYDRGVLALKLKSLYAAEAKKRQAEYHGNQYESAPSQISDEVQNTPTRTDEQLAKLAGMSRDTIRKIEVIETEVEKGNETAIKARDAIKSTDKETHKSINKAYLEVKPKRSESPKRAQFTDDGRRICSFCNKPINEGEYYESRPSVHKRCHDERLKIQQYKNPDISLIENVAVFSVDSLVSELLSIAEDLRDSWNESIEINESQGVKLSSAKKKRLEKAVSNLFETLNKIKESN